MPETSPSTASSPASPVQAFPTSEVPHLFTEHPDPTVVECARLHEAAETERVLIKERSEFSRQEDRHRHEEKRERLANWRDRGFQVLFGVTFCFVVLVGAITASVIAGDYAPPRPGPPAVPSAPPTPCTETVTRVRIENGKPMGCSAGASMTFEHVDPDTAVIRCACPKNSKDQGEAGSFP